MKKIGWQRCRDKKAVGMCVLGLAIFSIGLDMECQADMCRLWSIHNMDPATILGNREWLCASNGLF